jgi:hypothetical protein
MTSYSRGALTLLEAQLRNIEARLRQKYSEQIGLAVLRELERTRGAAVVVRVQIVHDEITVEPVADHAWELEQ